ncbi:MAG: hypothetical protein VB106_07275 [Clostridiaceae bacterium]|nr:hypothetical protein [Clostridiaceae bacterium]
MLLYTLTFTIQLDKPHQTCYHKFTAEKAVPKEAKRIEAKPDKSDASRVGSVRLFIFSRKGVQSWFSAFGAKRHPAACGRENTG